MKEDYLDTKVLKWKLGTEHKLKDGIEFKMYQRPTGVGGIDIIRVDGRYKDVKVEQMIKFLNDSENFK